MGKIVRYDKSTLGVVIFLTLLLLAPVHSYASYTEYDLLQQGYESYLSYQPEKAAEEFRAFLKEFPRSSARDAALFWLGKSLLQAKSADEAGQVFAELKRRFPDSPFAAFIVTQPEFSESDKLTTTRATEPAPQVETAKDSGDIRQPEPARQTDEAITEQTMRTDTASAPETPAATEAAAVPSPSESIQQQKSEPQPATESEHVTVQSADEQGFVSAKEDLQTKPADDMTLKMEEPGAGKSEVIKTESPEIESTEPVLQKSEVIESATEPSSESPLEEQQKKAEEAGPSVSGERKEQTYGRSTPDEITTAAIDETTGEHGKMDEDTSVDAKEHTSQFSGAPDRQRIDTFALVSPDVALPGIVPLEAVPEPENIEATDTVAAAKAGEQETVSLQPEVSSAQAPDAVTKGEEPEVKEPEVKEPEVKEPAQLPDDQAAGVAIERQAVEEEKELPVIREEQAQSENAGAVLPEEETPIPGATIQKDDEQVKTGELSPRATSENDTITYNQTALSKVGIQGALWSTGDHNQDFIDEQILYNEAVKLNLSADEDELNELRERYTLGIEEVDYLKRFLLICKLIDKKVKEIPGDRIVEVISVRYKDSVQREQPEFAAGLQALANEGVAFEDISRQYPDIVHFRTLAYQELPEWTQERIQRLQNYEIGVIWSEEGYMILKPIVQLYSYDPFEELSFEKREKLTAYIRSWIAELKGVNRGAPVSK